MTTYVTTPLSGQSVSLMDTWETLKHEVNKMLNYVNVNMHMQAFAVTCSRGYN